MLYYFAGWVNRTCQSKWSFRISNNRRNRFTPLLMFGIIYIKACRKTKITLDLLFFIAIFVVLISVHFFSLTQHLPQYCCHCSSRTIASARFVFFFVILFHQFYSFPLFLLPPFSVLFTVSFILYPISSLWWQVFTVPVCNHCFKTPLLIYSTCMIS